MVVGVRFHFTNQIEVTGRHSPRIVAARIEPAVEKPLRGKPKAGFPLRLEIPPNPRDSHFPTTSAAAFIPLPNPKAIPSPSASSRSNSSTLPGGYDVSRLFHANSKFAGGRELGDNQRPMARPNPLFLIGEFI